VQDEKLQELDRLREENKAAQRLQDQEAELERLRENGKELPRLRNEVTQLRQQLQELEILRAANAQLLQAVQGAAVQSNQAALVASARKMGAILGVSVRAPADGRAGVEVLAVVPNSSAATSGLAPGDIIYAVDGQSVQSPAELQAQMLTRKPGETVVLDVLRGETSVRVQVMARAWPQ
jgi:C-terminal processing protease CtpA/Prc